MTKTASKPILIEFICCKQEVLGFLHAQCICSTPLLAKWRTGFGSEAAQLYPSHRGSGSGRVRFVFRTP